MKRYGIRPDYTPNPVARTREDQGSVYWTPERIRRSADYQHHVYGLALDRARSHGYRTVLDVGCGPGLKARRHFADRGLEVTLVDQVSLAPVLERTAPELLFHAVDLENPSIDLGRQFDLVVCADVLEHLIDPDGCLTFVREHLAEDGRAVFSTPERAVVRGADCRRSPKPEHVREWDSAEFEMYLGSRGYEVLEHDLVPSERLPPIEERVRALIGQRIRLRRWTSCQVAVCGLSLSL